jgi:hypothetical protein
MEPLPVGIGGYLSKCSVEATNGHRCGIVHAATDAVAPNNPGDRP